MFPVMERDTVKANELIILRTKHIYNKKKLMSSEYIVKITAVVQNN